MASLIPGGQGFRERQQEGTAASLRLLPGVSALDLMGNPVERETVSVTETPVNLVAREDAVWRSLFPSNRPVIGSRP